MCLWFFQQMIGGIHCSVMRRLLIIDDHRLFMEGMRHLLQKLGNVEVDMTDNVRAALRKFDNNERYDLVLLDISIPGIDGFALLKSLSKRDIIAPVIMVSASFDIGDIRKSIELGALGFIHKNSTGSDMLKSIKKALDGETVIPPEFHDQLALIGERKNSKRQLVPEGQKLGERQLEVLKLMADGLSNREIATVLAITEATVKYHITIIFKELNVKSRTACLKAARLQSLVP